VIRLPLEEFCGWHLRDMVELPASYLEKFPPLQITFSQLWQANNILRKIRVVKYFITHFTVNLCYFVLGLRRHSHIRKTLRMTLSSAVTTACGPSVLIPSVREILCYGDHVHFCLCLISRENYSLRSTL